MLEVISDERSLRNAERRFQDAFRSAADWSRVVPIGFQGGAIEAEAHWVSAHGVWASLNDAPIGDPSPRRYWNAFGIQNPDEYKGTLSISVEINPPHRGIVRRVSGAVARDSETGSIFFLHRGRIGGGRSGIGATAFWSNWHPELTVEAMDGDRMSTFALVANLDDPSFVGEVCSFVKLVAQIKANEALTPAPTPEQEVSFNPEFFGMKQFDTAPSVTQLVNHGLVVNSLHDEMERRHVEVDNSKAMDLYIRRRGRVATVFEVKTSTTTTAIYTAIGQLMMNGRLRYPQSRLVLVLPEEDASTKLAADLRFLDIEVLFYVLDEGVARFPNLDKLLA